MQNDYNMNLPRPSLLFVNMKDSDLSKLISNAGYTLFGSIIGAIATITIGAFEFYTRDRTLDIEMVRISLSMLSGEYKDSSLPARRYALKALEKFSRVDIDDNEFDRWALTGTIPSSTIFVDPKSGTCLVNQEIIQKSLQMLRSSMDNR